MCTGCSPAPYVFYPWMLCHNHPHNGIIQHWRCLPPAWSQSWQQPEHEPQQTRGLRGKQWPWHESGAGVSCQSCKRDLRSARTRRAGSWEGRAPRCPEHSNTFMNKAGNQCSGKDGSWEREAKCWPWQGAGGKENLPFPSPLKIPFFPFSPRHQDLCPGSGLQA